MRVCITCKCAIFILVHYIIVGRLSPHLRMAKHTIERLCRFTSNIEGGGKNLNGTYYSHTPKRNPNSMGKIYWNRGPIIGGLYKLDPFSPCVDFAHGITTGYHRQSFVVHVRTRFLVCFIIIIWRFPEMGVPPAIIHF